jgi:hypothetical protein
VHLACEEYLMVVSNSATSFCKRITASLKKQGRFKMSTIEQIEQLVHVAEQLGYRIRYDYFGGTGGGVCEFSGGKWLFLDLALNSAEQLEQLQGALANEPLLGTVDIAEEVKQNVRRAA